MKIDFVGIQGVIIMIATIWKLELKTSVECFFCDYGILLLSYFDYFMLGNLLCSGVFSTRITP